MITDRQVIEAEYIIDTSGVVDILLEGRKRSNRGRKTNRDHYRLFLIGGFLNVHTRGNFVIDDVYATLTQRISLNHRLALRVRWPVPNHTGGHDMAVLGLHDLYHVSKGLNRYLAYGQGSAPLLSDEERERRHQVVQHFCDALTDVFDLGFFTRTYAIDATGLWFWGKGNFRSPAKETDSSDTDGKAA